MKGVSVSALKGPMVLEERSYPKLRSGYMLVQTAAVGVNPADILNIDYGFCVPGALMGCDYSGTVLEVSSEGVTRGWKKGDRVCGCTRGGDSSQFENGTFADVICVKADVQMKMPDSMSWEEGSALGVGVVTTGRAFYDTFELPYPSVSDQGAVDTDKQPKRQILIYGGSSMMGSMYIQFAKLSNFHVLTTCSPHNFPLVKSYGADFVVDYNSPTATDDLIAHTKSNEPSTGPLTLCLDAIAQPPTAILCSKVLDPEQRADDAVKRTYSAIMPFIPDLPGIKKVVALGYSFLGEDWEQMGQHHPASQDDFEAAKRFAMATEKLLAAGKIRGHPLQVRQGGLQGIVDGQLEEMRKGVSGKKIVYPLW